VRTAPDLWHHIESGLRASLPVTLALLLTLVCTLPVGPPGLGQIMPALPMICVFYWTVYRGDLMPLVATFVIGIAHDSLSGAPLGGSAIVLLTLQGLAARHRRFFHGKTIAGVWVGFVALVAVVQSLGWLIASFYHLQALPLMPAIFQALLTMALYPVITLPFGVILRELLQPLPVVPR